jgi:hypothetical protein
MHHNVRGHSVNTETGRLCPSLTLIIGEANHSGRELLVVLTVNTDGTKKSAIGKLCHVGLVHFPGSNLLAVIGNTVGNVTLMLPVESAVAGNIASDGRTNLVSFLILV